MANEGDESLLDDLAEYDSGDEAEPQVKDQPTKKDVPHTLHSSGFKEFLLKPELVRAIEDSGFEHPSQVQHECIPQTINGVDVICQAKSGMGKTAVFVLSVLHVLEPQETPVVTALVLCHTRELAYQIEREFRRFKKYLPAIKTGVVYGGVPVSDHRKMLREGPPHIVIGTPGRLLQLINEGNLKLDGVKHFILDECDKMLDTVEMRRDVQRIFKVTPHDKQVMMFSATLSDVVRPICKKFMHNPLEIFISDGKLTLDGLQQFYVNTKEEEKNKKLVDLLDDIDFNQVVIFVSSIRRATMLNKLLVECGFPSTCTHGRLKQEVRIERYQQFKEFQARIMVCTDLFGRGVDFEKVNVVFNYDLPRTYRDTDQNNASTYLHRVGRAGRFDTKGIAISFVANTEDENIIKEIEQRLVVEIPPYPAEGVDSKTYMNS